MIAIFESSWNSFITEMIFFVPNQVGFFRNNLFSLLTVLPFRGYWKVVNERITDFTDVLPE